MRITKIVQGLQVWTGPTVEAGILAEANFLAARRYGLGLVWQPLEKEPPFLCWWVKHPDGSLAPYFFHELEDASACAPALFLRGEEYVS